MCYTAAVSAAREKDAKPPAPTRRAFLGAAAATALAPAACVGPRPGATPQPSAADVPAARKNGMPAPDVEALLAR